MSSSHYEWNIGNPPPILGEHSVVKHDIFDQYIKIYIDHLTRTPSQTMLNLTIVDGFSGGGLYCRDGKEVEGSPLRLLRAVEIADQALAAARIKGFTIRADFFFVDAKRPHVEFLVDVLKRQGYGPRLDQNIFVMCSEFEEVCPDILQHIKKKGRAHRSLFFLDQYGWSDVRFATIRTILSELTNPEILLTFAVDALINFLSEKKAETGALLNIDLSREDVHALMNMRNCEGWRYLIQNGLYQRVQDRTGARFYTPFFIHSRESHRSYWLLHLSKHRQARDEMGKLHWRLTNHFQHHGGAGFHALGFDPSRDLRQGLFSFMFDDNARKRSEAAVREQLPLMIHAADRDGRGLPVEELFAGNCNDTPVTSDILQREILLLRSEGEIHILAEDGSPKPRAKTVNWSDRLVFPRQRSLLSRLG